MRRYPSDIARLCAPSDLAGQFILSQELSHLPDGWPRRRLGPWWLAVHPTLPAIDLIGPDSSRLGWLVGYPVDDDGHFASEALRWPAAPGDDAQVEEMLYATGGRYVCILIADVGQRVYLDPFGSLAAVFSPRHGIVASSTSLVPYSEGCDDDRPMIDALGIPDTSKWFPFGSTSRRYVERVLPNHFIDLERWTAVRHWPSAEILPDDDVESGVATIASMTKRNIAAVAERFPLHIGLTAGYDSRMLLALARAHLDQTVFFTLALGDAKARSDCRYGSRIAREFGLAHRVVAFEEPDRGDMTRWLYRSGCCAGEVRGLRAVTLCLRLDPWRAELPGLGGEIGRAYHWRDGDSEDDPVSVDLLLQRVGLPLHPRIVDGCESWLAALPPHRNALAVLDLLSLEERLGGWGGLLPYADPVSTAFRLYPFCHRQVASAMLRLPSDFRRREGLPLELILREWPELLRIPFNKPLARDRYLTMARRQFRAVRRGTADRVARLAEARPVSTGDAA